MRRSFAKNLQEQKKVSDQQLEETHSGIDDVAVKIMKKERLTLLDMLALSNIGVEKAGYDKKQLIVCATPDLSVRLRLYNIEADPVFCICSLDSKDYTKAVFSVLKLPKSPKLICLYKDFVNDEVPENLKRILKQSFDKEIEFKVNYDPDQTVNNKERDFALVKTLYAVMTMLKSAEKNKFIQNFSNHRSSDGSWFGNKLDSFSSYIKDKFASDIETLSKDTEFKKAMKELMDSIPMMDQVDNFKKYQSLLEEFVNLEENGADDELMMAKMEELEKAKKQAMGGTNEKKVKAVENEAHEWELEISKKFPEQMKKVNKIFLPLSTTSVAEDVDKELREISQKLDLDYDKLKYFYQMKEEAKKDVNVFNKIEIPSIEEVIKALPPLPQPPTLPSPSPPTAPSANPSQEPKEPNNKVKPTAQAAKPKEPINKVNPIMNNKPYDQVIKEIITNEISIDTLDAGYKKIKEYHEIWKTKDATEVHNWAVAKKGRLTASEIYEAIAVADRANHLITGGHNLRDPQILSALAFLLQANKGLLAQIQTGEGKTVIVAVVAAIKVLQGELVDVLTSNPVLASDGVREKKLFFDLLGLSVTTNNLDENYKSGERACYKADIVYGTMSSFQFDFLKDSFLGLDTRAGRPFKNIILDEVDNMIIDNAAHIAKLAGPLPGMESLRYVYIKIWQALGNAEEQVIEEFQKQLRDKAKELNEAAMSDDDAEIEYQKFEYELKVSIVPKISKLIKDSNPTDIDIIPSHLREYADHVLDKWIHSAINAKLTYNEDEQYVIRIDPKSKERVIQPIDYANTGITLKNTIWQYGLHQFLQLKHNLHLTAENLTSCFISNLGYINKYGSKVYGLTGTLGSEAEQDLLSSIYNVSFANIPTFKDKKFYEIEGEAVDDELYYEKIADDVELEITNGGAMLIICETIKDAKAIHEVLKEKLEDVSIRTYFDENNAGVTRAKVQPGEVIIATNIAGRGTDFKTTKELEKNGGLHVCVAFLPCNKRVEDQAFGRTARQGNNGSARLIIKSSEVEELGLVTHDFQEVKFARDLKEAERIKQLKEIKVLELNFQDTLFEKFTALFKKAKEDGLTKFVLSDLKEFWALWLEKNNFKGSKLKEKSVDEEFKNFESLAAEIIKGKITFNPYYSIQEAEFLLSNDRTDEAEKSLNHALEISKNPEILYSAYIKLFEIAIDKGNALQNKCKEALGNLVFISGVADREYKEKAKEFLRKAKDAVEKELKYVNAILASDDFQNMLTGDTQGTDNLFLTHLSSKQIALDLTSNHIEGLTQQINDHNDDIVVNGRARDHFLKLKPQNDNEKALKENLLPAELNELASIGANVTYTLGELHNVSEQIITGAKIQIGGGIALIATGLAVGIWFPAVIFFTNSIGITMITEGICDVVIEMLDKFNDGKFRKDSYIKGKVISYGVALLTMGLSAAAQCAKIFTLAKNACKWFSAALRKCPYLKKICESLATKFDKLGNWFEKLETIRKFNQMSKLQQLKYADELQEAKDLQKIKYLGKRMEILKDVGNLKELTRVQECVTNLKQVAVSLGKSVASNTIQNVIMIKVVTPALSSLMEGLKPKIREHVQGSVNDHINKEKLKSKSLEEVQLIIADIRDSIDAEAVQEIFKETILGIMKYCKNWKVQLGALALDQYDAWEKVYNYAKRLCIKINERMNTAPLPENANPNVQEIIDKLIDQFTEEMYFQLVNTTIQTSMNVYRVGTSALNNYRRDKHIKDLCRELNSSFKEGGEAGQEQALALSDVVKRPIEIIEENGNVVRLSEQYPGEPIKLSYFPPDEKNPTGHYVPYGKDKTWSTDLVTSKNNCLFDAVGEQIKKDPIELRKSTIRKIESNPTTYIAPHARDILDLEILLWGGAKREVKELRDDHYPSYRARIKVEKELKPVLAKLHNKLSEEFDEWESFQSLPRSTQHKAITASEHPRTAPKQPDPRTRELVDKHGMMLGALHVTFTNGQEFKALAASGDQPLTFRQPNETGTTKLFNPVIDGYQFLDGGKPKGKIFDVFNNKEISETYTRSCAAQKLFYELGEFKKKNPGLRIKDDKIGMTEVWFEYKKDKIDKTVRAKNLVIEPSCDHCTQVLPIATGSKGHEYR